MEMESYMHYYQHNIGDYARDTGHLSVIEHGIYRLLLDWCYLNEKPITTEQAMRVGRGYPTETQSVLAEFFLGSEEGWRHKRVDQELEVFHRRSARNRENGAKGGRPLTQKNPVGSQSQPTGNPNQEPITNNQKEERERVPAQRPAKPAATHPRPDDVDEQTWSDWLALRKAKKAPVTSTVVDAAKREAEKAGMALDAFLQVWCMRGSQGLQADWIKQAERATAPRTFAQVAADVARTTVPSRPGKDPSLEAAEADRAACKPMPEAVRARIASILPNVKVTHA